MLVDIFKWKEHQRQSSSCIGLVAVTEVVLVPTIDDLRICLVISEFPHWLHHEPIRMLVFFESVRRHVYVRMHSPDYQSRRASVDK